MAVLQALRSSFSESAGKFGMHFHLRFWERQDLKLPPSFGGKSLTDLPVRWILYPSYGIGEGGKGVLGMYTIGDDARQWRMMSKEDKIKRALHDLQLLYPELNIAQEHAGNEPSDEKYLTEAFGVDWWGYHSIILDSLRIFSLQWLNHMATSSLLVITWLLLYPGW